MSMKVGYAIEFGELPGEPRVLVFPEGPLDDGLMNGASIFRCEPE